MDSRVTLKKKRDFDVILKILIVGDYAVGK